MINRYALILSYSDRSGIIQAFGPYGSEAAAERAKSAIPEALPAITGWLWEVALCTDLESEGAL